MFKMKKTSFMVRCALQAPAMVLFLVVANPLRADGLPVTAGGGTWNQRNPGGAWNVRNSYVNLGGSTANHMVISQPDGSPANNWVLNWDSFNIDPGNRVQFIQPSVNHIALNRIAGGRSDIRGQIDANGRIYLINPNGFLFGSSSVINVNSLVASSLALNISDDDFIANNVNLLNVIDSGVENGVAFIAYYQKDPDTGEDLIDPATGDRIRVYDDPVTGESIRILDDKITIENGASIVMAGGINPVTGVLDTVLDDGGSVFIIAPEIINGGNISTRSGQVILAAAQDSVYLTPSNDPALRGFLVEVGGIGGDVTHAGNILAERGNITLAGLAINQNGILQATTSINENGSIRLLARDDAQSVDVDNIDQSEFQLGINIDQNDANGTTPTKRDTNYQVAQNGGEVILRANSRIEITPVASDRVLVGDTLQERTTTDNQIQQLSRVEVTGNTVRMQSGASITATGGEVLLHAAAVPQAPAVKTDGAINTRTNSLIELESGSRIDVSGTTTTQVAMERNQLGIQLTGDFLRDAPLQREGALRNERVNVDIREGTPLGDITADVAASIKRDITERLATGGSVEMLSQGGVIMQQGSEVNIAGGAVQYDAGYINTSRLVTTQGAVVAIADADPDLAYRGQFGSLTITPERWGSAGARSWSLFGGGSGVSQYFDTYTEGRDAGSFTIKAPAVLGMADVTAGTTISPYGRDPLARASGGTLNIITRDQNMNVAGNITAPDVADMHEWLQQTDSDAADFALQIDDDVFSSGLTRVLLSGKAGQTTVPASGRVTIESDAQIQMAADTTVRIVVDDGIETKIYESDSLIIESGAITVHGNIDIAGGKVTLNGGGIAIADDRSAGDVLIDGVIDVSGGWINDNPGLDANLGTAVAINGGVISITAELGDLQLTEHSELRANGGGWLQADGKLIAGEGGDITLAVKGKDAVSDLQLAGSMEAYGVNNARGGKLSITGNRIHIAPQTGSAETGLLQFTPEFFTRNGFADYALTANQGELVVASNTHITPRASNLLLNADAVFQRSGEDLRSFSHETTLAGYAAGADGEQEQPLADYVRAPTNLSLTANQTAINNETPPLNAGLMLAEGASITADAGASVSLASASRLLLNGDVTAHGGAINLTLNPYASEKSVIADKAIWLAGELDVSGAFYAYQADDSGLRRGRMFDGGDISLTAVDSGFVITGENSVMNVSAVADAMDLPASVAGNTVTGWSRQPVYGDAGSISVTAGEGFRLGGEMQAGSASATASAGSLNLYLSTANRSTDGDKFTNSQHGRQLNLVQSVADMVAAPVMGANLPITGADNMIGQGWVAADSIEQAGFDQLSLRVRNVGTAASGNGIVNLAGDVTLSLRQSLVLDTPIVRGNGAAQLNAAYVYVGSDLSNPPHASIAASGGSGDLQIHASGLLDLAGDVRLQGFDEVSLRSDGDLRVLGVDAQGGDFAPQGSLQAGRNLTLTADQIYATTFSRFDFGTTNTLNITAAGEHTPVLSAGSSLGFNADVINHAGVVKAPLGEIRFNADSELNIQASSLTSVSAEGQLIPFGTINGEENWVYETGSDTSTSVDAAPDKRISLNADTINMADGAVFDVSGGGDIYAWEHIPGLGGSNDNLLPEYNQGAFAVLPEYSGYAAYDPTWWPTVPGISIGSMLGDSMGDQIYLGASDGLAAGVYTLLPARYALLPGAMLVTPTGDNLLAGQTWSQVDGATVVAGQMRVANTPIADQQWSGFTVENGERVRSRSEYFEATGSQFFRDAATRTNSLLPDLAEDAGSLDILAQTSLSLGGSLLGDAASVDYIDEDDATQTARGRSSQVNIAGDNLRVVNAVDAQGGIQLLDDALNEFGTASLLLGGTRHRTADGTQIDVSADTVTIVAGAELQVPDVILVATDTITIENGASVHGLGDAGVLDEVLLVDGDGALVRVSNAAQVSIDRSHETGLQGEINVASGAVLEAGESMVLDASFNSVVNGELVMTDGSLNLGSSRISLGAVSGAPNGLVLDEADLELLNVNELVLTSRSSVDLYGDLELTFANLGIEAAAIDGYQQTGENAVLRAGNLRIGNPADNANNGTPTGLGNLTLAADNIELDDGRLALRGFNDVTLQSAGDIAIAGKGELDVVTNGTVTLNGRITASQRRADYSIHADDGLLVTTRTATTDLPARSEALAASLSLQAEQIKHQGVIDLASGDVSLQATGTDGVLLEAGSVINVSGLARDFAGDIRYSAGGNVELVADTGNINQQTGAVVNVSGGGDQGDAGALQVIATQGEVELAGSLLAVHGENAKGGRFVADAQIISNLSELNQQLNARVFEQEQERYIGFNQQRHIRLRQGNIDLDADESIVAHDVALATDTGNISINGLINASGDKGGTVNLAARDNVTLTAGAAIDAHATGTDQRGGQLFIETRGGMIDLAANSTIQLAGTGTGRDGRLHLRAPRTAGNNGLNIDSVAADISGFERIDVEGFRSYNPGSTLDSSDFITPFSEAEAFMANANDIDLLATLGFSVALEDVHLRPGMEFNTTGNLAIAAQDFFSRRYSNNGHDEAGVLSVRATGNLTVNGSLSDGFKAEENSITGSIDMLQAGESWSYRLVAGRDTAAAQVMATAGNSSDMTLAANQKIRTGTGNIEIAVADDLTLNAGASIYSAGENTGRGTLSLDGGDFTGPLLGPDSEYVGVSLLEILYLPGVQFPEHGGDVRIQTGGDIDGNVSSYLATDWLQRISLSGADNLFTTWGVDFREVKQGIGAFGGGDIQAAAGGDVKELALYSPVTGRQKGNINILVDSDTGLMLVDSNTGLPVIQPGSTNEVELLGGGNIALHAGGDVTQLLLHADHGVVDVNAGGSIGNSGTDSGVYLLLADSQIHIAARDDVILQGVNNATLQPMSKRQGVNQTNSISEATASNFFSTMSEAATLSLDSLGGDIQLRNSLAGSRLNEVVETYNSDAHTNFAANYPGSLSLLAMDGDISLGTLTMLPASQGELSLLAQNNIHSLTAEATIISMLDIAPASINGWENPAAFSSSVFSLFEPSDHATAPVHNADLAPARIVALNGDIAPLAENIPFSFNLPKAVEMVAGRDIVAVSLGNQNLRDSDVTLLQAGRDVRHINSALFAVAGYNQIVVGGPGEVQVLAGRNIDLADGFGITSTGNNANPALPHTGADVLVMAGVDADASYDAFINQYFTADSAYSSELIGFMNQRGFSFATEDFAGALAAFNALGVTRQRSLVMQGFFHELGESASRAAAEQNNKLDVADTDRFGYSRGLDAIAMLFPGSVLERREAVAGETTSGNVIVTGGYAYTVDESPEMQGNVSLISSVIKTVDDGSDLTVLTPGGMLNVGLSVVDKNATKRDLGILTKGDGDINIFALNDIAVNQSRIQALNGGDMTLWSSLGDIDAGRGSKSELGLPEPVLVLDEYQNLVYLEYPAVMQGSGIRSACFDAGCEDGNIILAAPAGVIDAGDAGINASGNLTLASDTVLNAGNIEAGGDSVGFSTETSAMGMDLGNLSSAGGDTTSTIAGDDAADVFSDAAIAILQVEVMGLEDDDKPAP